MRATKDFFPMLRKFKILNFLINQTVSTQASAIKIQLSNPLILQPMRKFLLELQNDYLVEVESRETESSNESCED